MSIGLSIVFTGLCALVTDGSGGPGQVVLVDAKGVGEIRGVLLPEHAPTLVMSLASLVNAESSRPDRVVLAEHLEQVGLWDLSGAEVRVRVQGGAASGPHAFNAAAFDSSWPDPPRDVDDPDAWRDLRFVAHMKPLAGDGRIDPALVAHEARGSSRLPRAVAARVYLEGGRVEAGIPSQEAYRDDVFEFRATGHEPRLRQALTDTLRWTLESGEAAVVIEIDSKTTSIVRQLVLKPRAMPHAAFVSNLPAENVTGGTHHAVDDDEMAALHFGVYYKLLLSDPGDWPLPRLSAPRGVSRSAGFIRPIYCPPAVFLRE